MVDEPKVPEREPEREPEGVAAIEHQAFLAGYNAAVNVDPWFSGEDEADAAETAWEAYNR